MGFGLSQLGAASVNNVEFDIFALNYDPVETPDKPYPVACVYLMLLIGMVLVSLVIQIVAFFSTGFSVGKKFAVVLTIMYAVFFIGSLVFGILARN